MVRAVKGRVVNIMSRSEMSSYAGVLKNLIVSVSLYFLAWRNKDLRLKDPMTIDLDCVEYLRMDETLKTFV